LLNNERHAELAEALLPLTLYFNCPMMSEYPTVKNVDLVGTYPALVKAGGGYVWDEVLEYRVWCHSSSEDDYYYAFTTFEEALQFSEGNLNVEEPVALILQEEYIDEPETGHFFHIKEPRLTEWPIEFLSRPRRHADTIPAFFAPDAPSNRLDIVRGLA
jgi:hypothetical protein